MLAFHLNWSDAGEGAWGPAGTGWAVGGGVVEPFRNPALEDFAAVADGRLLIVVRERCRGRAPGPAAADGEGPVAVDVGRWDELLREAVAWPLHAIALVLSTHAHEPRATILTGRWATGAVYTVARGDELFGDWDPSRLYAHLPAPGFDPLLTAMFLADFDAPYGSRTLFAGMRLLTDRSRALWRMTAGGPELSVERPPAVRPPGPADLKPDADVLEAFWEILTASVERWLPPASGQAGAELSGGLDSALVAAAAAASGAARLPTYGVILLGTMGVQQRGRRQEIVDRFGFRDTTIDLEAFLPLAQGSCRLGEAAVVPWEECYYEAMDRLMSLAAESGVGLMFTGVGGDELLRPNWAEGAVADAAAADAGEQDGAPAFLTEPLRELLRESEHAERAPQSIIASSALDAAAHCSTIAMRRGIWATHPLCTPELVRLCARLPREWHRDRAAERNMLVRLGCSRNVTHPPEPDSFSPGFDRAVRHDARPLLRELFADSRLADIGFVDQARLIADYDRWCESGADEDSVPFYSAAILELTARSLENPPAPVGARAAGARL